MRSKMSRLQIYTRTCLALAILIAATSAWHLWSIWNTPCHPSSFFDAPVQERLSDLSESLLELIEDDWLCIQEDRFSGQLNHREYHEKYGGSPAVSEAREVMAVCGFSRITVVNRWENRSVRFTCYRGRTRTQYDYVYFEKGSPPAASAPHGRGRKLGDHWIFGTGIVGYETHPGVSVGPSAPESQSSLNASVGSGST